MPLTDDPEILRRPIGFAVGLNREPELDKTAQRERLPGLLQFVKTFAAELLDKEFGTVIEGYPEGARKKTNDLRLRLRRKESTRPEALALLVVLIDLMDLEMEHEDASPENDPEEQEEFHDGILTFVLRLLRRFAAYATSVAHLPAVAAEAERGCVEFGRAAERLAL